jgi:hypothetical protein
VREIYADKGALEAQLVHDLAEANRQLDEARLELERHHRDFTKIRTIVLALQERLALLDPISAETLRKIRNIVG